MRNVLLGCDRLLTEIPDGGYNRCDTQEQLFEEGAPMNPAWQEIRNTKKGVYYVVPTPTKKFLKKVLDNNIYTFYE